MQWANETNANCLRIVPSGLFVMVFFCIGSINAINKMTINYMHKTLINTISMNVTNANGYRLQSMDLYIYFIMLYLYLKTLINLISFRCLFFRCNYNNFCPFLLLMVTMILQTNLLYILFVYIAFLHYDSDSTIYILFFILVDYIKSEWVCQRARFYYIHCLVSQRAHVIFILSVMTTFI